MGAELYFYKFQSEKAQSFLAPLLAQKGEYSFSEYVKNREKKERYFDGSKKRINTIISTCETNVEDLSIRDFELVIDWMYMYTTPGKDDKKAGGSAHWEVYEKLHGNCGFELIHEIACKHGVRAYLNMLDTYSRTIGWGNDWDLSLSASELRHFANFMIYYSNEMWRLVEIDYEKSPVNDTVAEDYSHLKGTEHYDLAIEAITKEKDEILSVFENLRKVEDFQKKFPGEELPDELDDMAHYNFKQYANQAFHGFHAHGLLEKLEGVKGNIKAYHSC